MSKKIRVVKHYSGVYSGVGADSQPVLSKSVCAAMLAGAMVLGGGVFVSSPAYADGYVDGSGNNIYYGFKTDAKYAEAHFNIDVEYYDTFEHAKAGGTEGKDPLGKYVRVHYLSNCHDNATADDWRFRPMWWFGVPAGLKDPQDIQFKRIEKLTNKGNQKVKPAGSSQYVQTDANGYGAVSDKHFNSPKDWTNISNYYFSDENILASRGWKQLMGLDTKGSKGYDNAGDTAKQWDEYQKQTQGLKGIFVDWESAGQRWYDMTYVSEMEDTAWKERDTNPLRFAAGVYRFAGNWHYAVGQKHNTPKIADHFNLVYPAVTKVKDTKKLTGDEQTAVKEKIENANKNAKYYSDLVEKVEVSENGDATITFKDKTTRTMPASLLVTKDESDSDKYKPTLPDAIPVVNPSALTKEDKEAVIAAFKKANENNSDFNSHLAETDGIKFDDKGENLVVTYKDGSTAKIPASELVFQGPKISDWAPYVVPDVIEVDDLTKLKQEEITKIVNEFDTANTGITPYDEAKEKNKDKKAPVTVDQTTGDATITWKDGSTTTIAAWQFLKQKPKAPSPDPQPPAPTPAAEKEFIVEAPASQTRVKFDPFNMKEADLTTYKDALDSTKTALKKNKGKDSKDNSDVTITDVTYSVVDGKGYITFKADNYKDATYPMSVFFKKDPGTQTPQTPSTETKTETDTEHPENTFTYKVTKTEIDGDNPTAPDAVKALKQFVRDNYDNVKDSDLANVTDSITISTAWTPKPGTVHMGAWDNTSNSDPVTSIQLSGDFGIQVNGHQWMEDEGWSAGMEGTLFTIKPSDLYVKKSSTQHPTDTTIEDLKKQAKDLLNKRKNTDNLSNEDLKRAGITDPDQLNDSKIDSMAQGTTAEKDLRDLIRKLTDAKKADYKYNTDPYEADKGPSDTDFSVTDDMFKGAVKKFLHANYDDSKASAKIDNLSFNGNTATLTGKGWAPKEGTSGLELKSDSTTYGITTVTMGSDGKSVDFKNGDTVLFNVPADKLYKKKDATPTPNPSAEDLKKFKEQAKEIIERNPKLTDQQKEDYKKQIDGADTKEKIQNILKEANKQAGNNNVKPEDIKKKENEEKEKKEREKREKDKKDKENQQLQDDKKKASDAIDGLGNLTEDEKNNLKKEINGGGTPGDSQGATTPEAVKKILDKAKAIDGAKGALQNDIAKGALPFLDHGTGAEGKTDTTHADDAALNELLGTKPAEDSTLKALADKLKEGSKATAEEIKNALDAAKRQNAINEENAKNAGIAKLDALLQQLTDAENGLTADQKTAVSEAVTKAKNAIEAAKTSVKDAKKPSDIKTAVDKVSIKDAMDAINTQVTNAQKTNASDPSQTQNGKLDEEKQKAKERVNATNLSQEEKDKFNKQIDDSKKSGDPTAIADRALKAKKIADALDKLDKDFNHLNKAQKEAFKKIIEDTDAGDHTNADGTTSDDIDDALANAANTDNAMARLEELKKKANDFKNEQGGKYSKLDSTNPAEKKQKDDFDKYFDDATTLTTADKGDAKGADEVNTLYNDLLKAMRAIDPKAQSAGLKTDALKNEIESDNKLKPDDKADPKTPGDSVYTTASKEKKDEFDKALNEAQTVLNGAKTADISDADKEATEQKEIDAALDKLIKARLALDGIDTKPLEEQIAKDADIKKSVEYTKASDSKKKAYDEALQKAKDLIDKLTGKVQPAAGDNLDSKDAKQKALDAALKALSDAAEALDGKDTTPVPPSGDDNTGSGSESDSGSGDSTSTSGGVNKQNLINQINTTENPGGANPGSGAAGTNPSTPGAGAQGAGMGAVTPGSGAGAAGTGAAGAANAGVDNKAVNNAVENAPEVKQADAAVKQAAATLDEALAQAKRVAADPHATQEQVDAAAAKLADARKALADAQANAAKVRAAVRSRVIKGMRSRGNAGIATGANVATTGLMATMIAAIGGAFATRRMRTKHANRD